MNDTKRTPLGNPIDPASDAQQQFSDPAGMTGVTNTSAPKKILSADDLLDLERDSASADGMVSILDNAVTDKDLADLTGDAESDADELFLDSLDGSSDQTINDSTPTDLLGELSVSGDMPDPESDDDMLLNSHQVGLRLDEDYDNPKPLNMAADVAAAERSRRGS
jgi:hypothetical protein